MIPAELTSRAQWIVWRYEQRDGKPTKVPYQSVGRPASTTNPATWRSYPDAVGAVRAGPFDGLGYVFAADDPYAGVDFDACVTDGELHPGVAALVRKLDSYSEISPSGTGVHTIVRAQLNGGRHRTRETVWGGEFETYDRARYFAMTGRHMAATPRTIEARQEQHDAIRAELFGPEPEPAPTQPSAAPADRELLERARNARNGRDFERLWDGDTRAYGDDDSRADLALCGLLAFWAGPDPAAIDALFRRSGLMRAKWEREDYRTRTIDRALAGRTDFYDWTRARTPEPADRVPPEPADPSPGAKPDGEDDAGASPERARLLTAAATCALPDPPQSDELLGPLLMRGYRLVLGAHTGHGKTTFAMALVRAVTERQELLGFTGAGGRALFIDAEQGLRTIKRRLREAELHESEHVDVLRVPDGLELDRNDAQIEHLQEILATGAYSVVIADPLYKLHAGDSNEERAAVNLMRRFDRWREQHRFAFVVPVHCRKPPPGAKFTMHEFFGSSAYLRGAEVVLGLQRVRDGYTQLHFFKDRDGDLPTGSKWGLLFDREQGYRRDPEDGAPKQTTADKIRELLEQRPGLTQAQIAEATGRSERTVREALHKLGAKPTQPGPREPTLWDLEGPE